MKHMEDVTQRTVDYLGEENLPKGLPSLEARYILPVILEGINKNAVLHVLRKSGLQKQQMARLMGISTKWIDRIAANETLQADRAEKLILICRTLAEGEEAFGDAEKFRHWLTSKLPALGGKPPMEFLGSGTVAGFDVVRRLLSMVKYGDFAA